MLGYNVVPKAPAKSTVRYHLLGQQLSCEDASVGPAPRHESLDRKPPGLHNVRMFQEERPHKPTQDRLRRYTRPVGLNVS